MKKIIRKNGNIQFIASISQEMEAHIREVGYGSPSMGMKVIWAKYNKFREEQEKKEKSRKKESK